MDSFLDGFTIWNAAALIASALLIGLNKTGIPGIGLLPVLLLTMTFPTRLSTGLQLGMLCMADVIAVIWYRRNANWRLILRLIPAAAAGLLAGTLLVNQLNDRTMAVTIGIIVLFLCGISIVKDYVLKDVNRIPTHWTFGATAGFLAGFTTLIANAAGPVMALYFLALKLEKKEYVGTGAWFFLLMNWTKLPIFVCQERITMQSAMADLIMLPFIIVGAIIGSVMLKHISQEWFNRIVVIFSIIAALKLIFF